MSDRIYVVDPDVVKMAQHLAMLDGDHDSKGIIGKLVHEEFARKKEEVLRDIEALVPISPVSTMLSGQEPQEPEEEGLGADDDCSDRP